MLFQFFILTNAQNIQGKIVSNEYKMPIPYAKIGLEDEEIGTFADENGFFNIDLTKVGRKKILKLKFRDIKYSELL
uniref:carboxypeptidase-like regulatory domain-containing protein n=1 Tax=Riemerella anatipestifer TaxID=34085 RepID=UPI0030EDB613